MTFLRRTLMILAAGGATVALAAPAGADTPVGWPEEPSVDMLEALLVLGGIPIAISLLLAAFVYVPALARGERVVPGAPEVEDQWIGGPRKSPQELPAADAESSGTGGTSGRW